MKNFSRSTKRLFLAATFLTTATAQGALAEEHPVYRVIAGDHEGYSQFLTYKDGREVSAEHDEDACEIRLRGEGGWPLEEIRQYHADSTQGIRNYRLENDALVMDVACGSRVAVLDEETALSVRVRTSGEERQATGREDFFHDPNALLRGPFPAPPRPVTSNECNIDAQSLAGYEVRDGVEDFFFDLGSKKCGQLPRPAPRKPEVKVSCDAPIDDYGFEHFACDPASSKFANGVPLPPVRSANGQAEAPQPEPGQAPETPDTVFEAEAVIPDPDPVAQVPSAEEEVEATPGDVATEEATAEEPVAVETEEPEPPEEAAPSEEEVAPPTAPQLDLKRWKEVDFHTTRQELEERASDPEAMVDLAHLYLAWGLPEEARGIARSLNSVRELRDYAAILHEVADTLAGNPRADSDSVWQEHAAHPDRWPFDIVRKAALDAWEANPDEMRQALERIESYTPEVASFLLPHIAETAIRERSAALAGEAVGRLKQLAEDGYAALSSYHYVSGLLERARRRSGPAYEHFQKASELGSDPWAVKARVWRIEQDKSQNTADLEEIISELSEIARSWRGDSIELRTLEIMRSASDELHDIHNQLWSRHRLGLLVQDEGRQEILRSEYNALLERLYSHVGRDDIPLETFLLVDSQFADSPLADSRRLRKLLARNLLDNNFVASAEIIARRAWDEEADREVSLLLGEALLSNRKFDQALQVLKDVEGHDADLMKAKAAYEKGEYLLAMSFVNGHSDDEARYLKSLILWDAQDYGQALEEMEQIEEPLYGTLLTRKMASLFFTENINQALSLLDEADEQLERLVEGASDTLPSGWDEIEETRQLLDNVDSFISEFEEVFGEVEN